jgi:hypothetical protein
LFFSAAALRCSWAGGEVTTPTCPVDCPAHGLSRVPTVVPPTDNEQVCAAARCVRDARLEVFALFVQCAEATSVNGINSCTDTCGRQLAL